MILIMIYQSENKDKNICYDHGNSTELSQPVYWFSISLEFEKYMKGGLNSRPFLSIGWGWRHPPAPAKSNLQAHSRSCILYKTPPRLYFYSRWNTRSPLLTYTTSPFWQRVYFVSNSLDSMPLARREIIDFDLEIQPLPIRLGINRRPRDLPLGNFRIPFHWGQRALLVGKSRQLLRLEITNEIVRVGILLVQLWLLNDDRIPSKTPFMLGIVAFILGILEDLLVFWGVHGWGS